MAAGNAKVLLMSASEFANECGVSRQAIFRMIKDGVISKKSVHRPPREPGSMGRPAIKINAARAKIDIELNGDASRLRGKGHKQVTPKKKEKPKVDPAAMKALGATVGEEAVADESEDLTELENKAERLRDARISGEELKSRKLELLIEEKEGTLVNAEQARRKIIQIGQEIKNSLSAIPVRLAPQLVAITDVLEMENRLRAEIEAALEALSRVNQIGAKRGH